MTGGADTGIVHPEAKRRDGKDSQCCPEVGEICGKYASPMVSVQWARLSLSSLSAKGVRTYTVKGLDTLLQHHQSALYPAFPSETPHNPMPLFRSQPRQH